MTSTSEEDAVSKNMDFEYITEFPFLLQTPTTQTLSPIYEVLAEGVSNSESQEISSSKQTNTTPIVSSDHAVKVGLNQVSNDEKDFGNESKGVASSININGSTNGDVAIVTGNSSDSSIDAIEKKSLTCMPITAIPSEIDEFKVNPTVTYQRDVVYDMPAIANPRDIVCDMNSSSSDISYDYGWIFDEDDQTSLDDGNDTIQDDKNNNSMNTVEKHSRTCNPITAISSEGDDFKVKPTVTYQHDVGFDISAVDNPHDIVCDMNTSSSSEISYDYGWIFNEDEQASLNDDNDTIQNDNNSFPEKSQADLDNVHDCLLHEYENFKGKAPGDLDASDDAISYDYEHSESEGDDQADLSDADDSISHDSDHCENKAQDNLDDGNDYIYDYDQAQDKVQADFNADDSTSCNYGQFKGKVKAVLNVNNNSISFSLDKEQEINKLKNNDDILPYPYGNERDEEDKAGKSTLGARIWVNDSSTGFDAILVSNDTDDQQYQNLKERIRLLHSDKLHHAEGGTFQDISAMNNRQSCSVEECDMYRTKIDDSIEDDDSHVIKLAISIDALDGYEQGRGYSSDKEMDKSLRSVYFSEQLVTAIYELEPCNTKEKENMFWTSKDMQEFRLDYVWELHEAHEERQRRERWSLRGMLKFFSAVTVDILTCRAAVNMCHSQGIGIKINKK